jgi:hypothetical protein
MDKPIHAHKVNRRFCRIAIATIIKNNEYKLVLALDSR